MPFLRSISQTGNINLAIACIRLWCGSMTLYHGVSKLHTSGEFVAYVNHHLFLPDVIAWAVIAAQILSGAFLALGLFSRPAALSISIMTGFALFFIHTHIPFTGKELSVSYMVASLAIFISGGGSYSIDNKLSQR